MDETAVLPRSAELIIEPRPLATRLRLKGQRVRYTRDGKAWDYRVASVSMPDRWGRCKVALEALDG